MNPILLRGKKVVGSEGYILGEFDRLHVDLSNWTATAFYVGLTDEATDELDFKKPFLSKIIICLPTQLIKAVGDVITLTEPIRNLKEISEKSNQLNETRLEGKKMVGEKGYDVGEVEGLELDVANWQITGLHVGLTDDSATELGFKRPLVSKVVVIIPTDVIDAVGNFITLDKAVENLKSLVECIKSCQKLT
jgi:sporulation protein YlmC with PRC-barrel domain